MSRIGSLCSGAGGLDLGVMAALGGTVAWHAEIDPAASRVLDRHWPDVPNHGDLALVDWTQVEPVDVLTAGYPCQPFSYAGQRKGASDARHIWPNIADTVCLVRPRLVLLENVPGHLSLGFGQVLGELAELGYVGRWACLRAAGVGAPHGRKRVFIVATDSGGEALRLGAGLREGRKGGFGRGRPDDNASQIAADTDQQGRQGPQPAARRHMLAGALLPTPRATDGTKGGPNQRGTSGDLMLPSAVMLLPTPESSDGTGGQVSAEMGGTRPSGAKRAVTLATALSHGVSTPMVAARKAQATAVARYGATTRPRSTDGRWSSAEAPHPRPS